MQSVPFSRLKPCDENHFSMMQMKKIGRRAAADLQLCLIIVPVEFCFQEIKRTLQTYHALCIALTFYILPEISITASLLSLQDRKCVV